VCELQLIREIGKRFPAWGFWPLLLESAYQGDRNASTSRCSRSCRRVISLSGR